MVVPGTPKESQESVPPLPKRSIARRGTADTKDVQQIAASQLELLTAYHQVALGQSNRSFFWALIGSGIGLLLFALAVGFSLLNGLSLASSGGLLRSGKLDRTQAWLHQAASGTSVSVCDGCVPS